MASVIQAPQFALASREVNGARRQPPDSPTEGQAELIYRNVRDAIRLLRKRLDGLEAFVVADMDSNGAGKRYFGFEKLKRSLEFESERLDGLIQEIGEAF